MRHGLTAETVVSPLENAEEYIEFEAAIIAHYAAQSVVARELALRLASLLWRLRRAAHLETGLFNIQASHVRSFRRRRNNLPAAPFSDQQSRPDNADSSPQSSARTVFSELRNDQPVGGDSSDVLALCFLRLANLPSFALDRLNRYEATIWRQAAHVMLTLDLLRRRKDL
jgi:hypothetical protein